ncbi:rnhA [Lepeophtheirus salmonis]|uniref:RnhA n=1 Tax=Lepeophtheirus salmonis TaxID=72036 RepID=A0A7R8CGA7_LEPSM|nr:rnhA [Lepeophtheirus salmonis]CAF2814675.1 rnhA [Lepeophtheirus salmonis]
MPKWKKNGWKKSYRGHVINKNDFRELEDIKKGMTVKFIHIQAHKGIKGDKHADALSRKCTSDLDLVINLPTINYIKPIVDYFYCVFLGSCFFTLAMNGESFCYCITPNLCSQSYFLSHSSFAVNVKRFKLKTILNSSESLKLIIPQNQSEQERLMFYPLLES